VAETLTLPASRSGKNGKSTDKCRPASQRGNIRGAIPETAGHSIRSLENPGPVTWSTAPEKSFQGVMNEPNVGN